MKENKHWMDMTHTTIPKKTLKRQLINQEEEKRVMIRRHEGELTFINWQIWLTKDHLSLPYKKHSWKH